MAKSPAPIEWKKLPEVTRKSSPWRKLKRRAKRYFLPISLAVAVALAVTIVVIVNLKKVEKHSSDAYLTISGSAMGSTWSVKIPTAELRDTTQNRLKSEITTLLDKLDSEMSLWNSQSEVSKFNDYLKEDWYPVPQEIADVVNKSILISEQTEGAFDITVAPLVFLWGFGPKNLNKNAGWIPNLDQITRTRQAVGFSYLQCQLNPPSLRKIDQSLQLDLGGIGKGYATDKVAEYLDLIQIKNYLVAVGGELRSKGEGVDGGGWNVGIQIPSTDNKRIFRQVNLINQCLSTSGDYNNILSFEGKVYSHLINPLTGVALERRSSSVSVLAGNSVTADALATAFMILGKEKGLALASRLKVEALFIWKGNEDKFESAQTPGFPK